MRALHLFPFFGPAILVVGLPFPEDQKSSAGRPRYQDHTMRNLGLELLGGGTAGSIAWKMSGPSRAELWQQEVQKAEAEKPPPEPEPEYNGPFKDDGFTWDNEKLGVDDEYDTAIRNKLPADLVAQYQQCVGQLKWERDAARSNKRIEERIKKNAQKAAEGGKVLSGQSAGGMKKRDITPNVPEPNNVPAGDPATSDEISELANDARQIRHTCTVKALEAMRARLADEKAANAGANPDANTATAGVSAKQNANAGAPAAFDGSEVNPEDASGQSGMANFGDSANAVMGQVGNGLTVGAGVLGSAYAAFKGLGGDPSSDSVMDGT